MSRFTNTRAKVDGEQKVLALLSNEREDGIQLGDVMLGLVGRSETKKLRYL